MAIIATCMCAELVTQESGSFLSCEYRGQRRGVLAQREMEKRRSPVMDRFRPDGRGFSRHLGVYRPMSRSGECTARESKFPRC